MEEIISVDTTNNNLKWDQHKIPWNKYNKHNDEKIHVINSIQLRYHICKSIYHMAQNFLEKYDALYTKAVPYQSDFDHPEQLKTLVLE